MSIHKRKAGGTDLLMRTSCRRVHTTLVLLSLDERMERSLTSICSARSKSEHMGYKFSSVSSSRSPADIKQTDDAAEEINSSSVCHPLRDLPVHGYQIYVTSFTYSRTRRRIAKTSNREEENSGCRSFTVVMRQISSVVRIRIHSLCLVVVLMQMFLLINQ